MSVPAAIHNQSDDVESNRLCALRSNLEIQVARVNELTADQLSKWDYFIETIPELASPYFSPEFTKCVANVRDDVEIAVIKSHAKIVGLFPFQRVGKRLAHPVGGMMNDYHGIIGPPELSRCFPQILQQCGLDSWAFHSESGTGVELARFEYERIPCPYIDLTSGFEHYYQWVRSHSKTMKRQKQKTSKMERELGTLKLEFDCRDVDVLDSLIAWKRAKYQRTKTFDILSVDWTVDLLKTVFQKQSNGFRGVLSAMWAGEKLVAAHMGLANGKILHYWFPVINVDFGKYSPGTEMFLQIAKEAATHKIDTIDLGYGDEGFKSKWATHRKFVGRGNVQFGRLKFLLARSAYKARIAAKSMPMKETAKTILRKIHPNFGKRAFR